ncbi:MAG: twin-arginine translocase TatA/TatE family subunit [Chloroflexi bacterium]|nr:twin-arginine translocase TatA/TatE family subunit [Chloroflexota bacterium]
MPTLGPWELGLILVIVVIVFGVGKLPEVGGALGRGLKEFKRGAGGEDTTDGTVKSVAKDEPALVSEREEQRKA